MPGISGELLADFSDFQRACTEATVTLKGMETGGANVEKSLDRMVNSFSGKTLVQNAMLMVEAVERIGGASKLTEAELQRVATKAAEAAEKLRAVGKDVPENLQRYASAVKEAEGGTSLFGGALSNVGSILAGFGLTASIGAIVGLTKEVFSAADALDKMHNQTDISVEDLQRMQIVGDGAGVALTTMTSGANRLTAALGRGDKGVSAALADMNIDLDHFKTLGAADQLEAISRAVQGMEDPLRVAADLSALYGRSWAEQLPALKQGFTDLGDGATVMSARTVSALDAAGDAVGEFWRATKANLGEAVADILTLSTSEWRALKSAVDEATAAAGKMRPEGLTPVKEGLVDVSGAMDLLNAGLDEQTTKVTADVAAQKKFADAMVELNSSGKGWQGTLETINGETVEAIKAYLDAGVAQNTLATAYGLTAVQVKAVASAQQDAVKATKEWQDIENLFAKEAESHYKEREEAQKKSLDTMNSAVLTGFAQTQKARDQYHDAEMKATLSSSDYQLAKIKEWAEAQKLAFGGTVQQRDAYNAAIDALAKQQADALIATTSATLDQMFGEATFKIAKFADDTKKEVDQATAAMQQQYSMVGGQQLTQAEWDAYYQTPAGIADIVRNHGKRYYAGEHGAVLRAEGGPVSAGAPYIVGERGPELFVPQSAGTVLPNGAGGMQVVINITQPLGDPQTIARAVEDAMSRSLRSSGVRLPSGA